MEFSLSLIFWLASGLGDLWQVVEKTEWNFELAVDVMKPDPFQNELGGGKNAQNPKIHSFGNRYVS